jgi:hypothetical protein
LFDPLLLLLDPQRCLLQEKYLAADGAHLLLLVGVVSALADSSVTLSSSVTFSWK